jgi:hypothetical protein
MPTPRKLIVRHELHTQTFAARLNADQPHFLVLDKVVERSDRVTATSDACDNGIGQLALRGSKLLSDLPPDDFLKVAHDSREWMWADSGAHEIVRRRKIGHPVSHRFVDCVFERARTRADGYHLHAAQS